MTSWLLQATEAGGAVRQQCTCQSGHIAGGYTVGAAASTSYDLLRLLTSCTSATHLHAMVSMFPAKGYMNTEQAKP